RPGPKKPMEKDGRRIVWIDDLAVETQASPDKLLSLEVQNDDPEGRLLAGGQIGVSVGASTAVKRGKVTLSARNVSKQPVGTQSVDLEVPAEGFANVVVPLRELAEKKPRGPIDIDVVFQDAAKPGTRIDKRITLKSAVQACIVYDFEEPVAFTGYQPGKVTK